MLSGMTDRSGETLNRRRFLACGSLLAAGIAVGGLMRVARADDQRIAALIAEAPPQHAIVPALRMAADSLTAVEKLAAYEATLVRTEMVDGELLSGRMQLKLRESPKAVYLKFEEPHAGREVIYRADAYDGQLQVRDSGIASLVGTVSIDPTGSIALQESRHPMTRIGLKTMLELLIGQWVKESKIAGTTVNFYPNAKIGELPCQVIEVSHQTRHPDVVYQMTRLYIDSATNLPVRVQNYDFAERAGSSPVLVEDYYYQNLRAAPGLKNVDFDTSNPRYGF
jgi:hypothetical protein